MKKAYIFVTMFAMALSVMAQEPKNVLFIGNSYTEVNNLPALVQHVAESAGERITYRASTPGGCTFAQHCVNQSMALIQEGGWDYVVLQEQSQAPAFPLGQVQQECFPYAQQLVQAVYRYNPDGEPMFYMTWGYRNGDERNGAIYPPIGTYEGMDSLLYERYMYMARTFDASVCPVGRVWRKIRNEHGDIDLYQSEYDNHPSLTGSYAAACAFFTMIFHRSPLDITYNPGINDAHASIIRQVVKDVVYDTLSFWLRQNQTIDTTSTDTATIDTTTIDTTTIDTTVLSINRIDRTNLRVYPNPVRGQFTVTLGQPQCDCQAILYDPRGSVVRRFTIRGEKEVVNVSDLPAGVYNLVVMFGNDMARSRVVIR